LKTFTPADVRLEDWVRGPLFIADTEAARRNKAMMELHFLHEWNADIEATMATIHSDGPWQRIPALGVDVNGVEAVRDYYLRRFETWPGPAMKYFDRATVADTCLIVEGTLSVQPQGGFGAIKTEARLLTAPCVIICDFRDGLILGETVYVDGAALKGQLGGRDGANG
jgi:ketosteroid isomerase-like protein